MALGPLKSPSDTPPPKGVRPVTFAADTGWLLFAFVFVCFLFCSFSLFLFCIEICSVEDLSLVIRLCLCCATSEAAVIL